MEIFASIADVIALSIVGIQERLLSASLSLISTLGTIALGLVFLTLAAQRSKTFVFSAGAAVGATVILAALAVASQAIGEIFLDGMITLGLRAGGSSVSADSFLGTPDAWLARGWAQADRLMNLGNVGTPYGLGFMQQVLTPPDIKWAFWVAGWGVYFTYIIAAAMMLSLLLFYKLAMSFSLVMIPLSLVTLSRRFGLGPLNFMVKSLASIFSLTLVMTMTDNIMTRATADLPDFPTYAALLPPAAVAVFILIMLKLSRSFAGAMIGEGTPSTSSMIAPALMTAAMTRGLIGTLSRANIGGGGGSSSGGSSAGNEGSGASTHGRGASGASGFINRMTDHGGPAGGGHPTAAQRRDIRNGRGSNVNMRPREEF